jgi:threonine synthase
MKNRFESLQCARCGRTYPIDTHSRCENCDGILESRYRLGRELPLENRGRGMWDFAEFLPPVKEENIVSMGEGWTPYLDAPTFAKRIGLRRVWCKVEGCNPTGSFKDRAASLGLSLATEWKKGGVFTASDGNAGASISAYSARARMKCLVLISDDAPAQKIAQTMVHSPVLVRVRGLYASLESLESALRQVQAALPNWLNHFIWAPVNPLLVDAYKTIAYEIGARNEAPDFVFVPVAGGELLSGLHRGFKDLIEIGRIERVPRLVAVQGVGADPTVQAIQKGVESVIQTGPPTTVAGALRVNFSAEHPVKAVRNSGGFGISVSDSQILSAQRQIAQDEGIFCETSSAVAFAGMAEARALGRINKDDRVSAVVTGTGLKDYSLVAANISSVPLAEGVSSISSVLERVLNEARSDS